MYLALIFWTNEISDRLTWIWPVLTGDNFLISTVIFADLADRVNTYFSVLFILLYSQYEIAQRYFIHDIFNNRKELLVILHLKRRDCQSYVQNVYLCQSILTYLLFISTMLYKTNSEINNKFHNKKLIQPMLLFLSKISR